MQEHNSLPFITIIMPIRNEEEYIERSLHSALIQNYPSLKMEVNVADGMSDDKTTEILDQFQKDNRNLKVLNNSGRIVSSGLNKALEYASGEIIIRIDGHCEIAHDYVSRCVEHLQNDGVDVVGGPMETIGETYISRGIALAMSSPFGVGNSAFRTVKNKSMLVDSVPFAAYRRETIEKAGLFDEELVRNQDDEYNYRLRKMGAKILLAEDICSKYFSRSSIRSLFKQYFQYGYWKVRVLQKHPRQMKLRQFVPPTFVLSILISLFLSMMIGWGKSIFTIIIGSYILTNLIGSIWTTRSQWKYFPILPIAFFTLHFSYGLGFLVGLFRFIHRWGDKEGKVPTLQRIHA